MSPAKGVERHRRLWSRTYGPYVSRQSKIHEDANKTFDAMRDKAEGKIDALTHGEGKGGTVTFSDRRAIENMNIKRSARSLKSGMPGEAGDFFREEVRKRKRIT